MTKQQKQANQEFFEWNLSMVKDGGTYIWPDKGYSFTVNDGNYYGAIKELKAIAKITPKAFHKRLKVGAPPKPESMKGKTLLIDDDTIMEEFGLDEDKPSNKDK